MDTRTFISKPDNVKINFYHWKPKETPKAVIQIVHGSIENAMRYEKFAKYLTSQGFAVYAMDIRGHGETGKKTRWGYFSDLKHSENIVLNDVHYINNIIKKENQNKKIILLGHSMGSFIVRAYITKYSDVDMIIPIGTNHPQKIISSILAIVSSLKRAKKPSKFIHNLSYVPFNKRFKKEKDSLAWLSVSKDNRKEYLASEYTKFIMTNNGFNVMAKWMKMFTKAKLQINKIPILLINGADDPVGIYGKEVTKAFKFYKKLGFKVKHIEYAKYRHEVLNENDIKVFQDIIKFVDNQLKI